jgi:hypothetical protein
MPVALIVVAAAAVTSQVVKANGARKAANEQKKGIEAGKADINTAFDKAQTYQDPYVDAGKQAIGQLSDGTKAGGDFNRSFTMADFQADPGYEFRQQQGQRAVDMGAAARGGVLSGAALKGEQKFGQDLAANEYQSAYTRFNNDINSRFNRLSSVAQMGQHAADISTNSEQTRGTNLGNLSINKGNVNAAKELAYSNAGANAVTSIGNAVAGGMSGGGGTISQYGSGFGMEGNSTSFPYKNINTGGSTSYA